LKQKLAESFSARRFLKQDLLIKSRLMKQELLILFEAVT